LTKNRASKIKNFQKGDLVIYTTDKKNSNFKFDWYGPVEISICENGEFLMNNNINVITSKGIIKVYVKNAKIVGNKNDEISKGSSRIVKMLAQNLKNQAFVKLENNLRLWVDIKQVPKLIVDKFTKKEKLNQAEQAKTIKFKVKKQN